MKNIYLTLIPIFISLITFSQSSPAIAWQRVIGGNSDDYLYSAKATDDGGFILAGKSRSGISGDKTETLIGDFDYWVVKLDGSLNVAWQNSIRAFDYDQLTTMDISEGNGCIIGGDSNSDMGYDKSEDHLGTSPSGDRDYWVVKMDEYGGPVWDNTIGGGLNDYMKTVIQTSDGGYLLGGWSSSDVSFDKTEDAWGYSDYWIVKLNSDGEIEGERTIGGSGTESLTIIRQTPDGGYFLGGYSSSYNSGVKSETTYGGYDYWILRLDSAGAVVWDRTAGGSEADYLTDLQITPDGGCIAVGYSYSDSSGLKTENSYGYSDYWVVKLSMSGDVQWENTIGGDGEDFCMAVDLTSDGYILGGTSYSDYSGDKSENTLGSGDKPDYWIVRLNIYGEVVWDNTIGGLQYDYLTSLEYQPDGRLLIGGYSNSKIGGDKTFPRKGGYDFWTIMLEPEAICPPLIASITPSGPTTFCKPDSVVFNAFPSVGYSFQWKKNGVDIAGATNNFYVAASSGSYSVLIADGACNDLSDGTILTAVNKPPAVIENLDAFNNLCFDPSIKLKASFGAGFTYQWAKDLSLISGATSQIYYATVVGNYQVLVTNATGCSKLSPPYSIIYSCRIGNFDNASVSIYPNPNTGTFTVNIEGLNQESIEIRILNLLGEEIYAEKIRVEEKINHTIELNAIENGMYIIEIKTEEKVYLEQIIIAK